MNGSGGMPHGGAMRLIAEHATAKHGTVSFFVTNGGSVNHEMVILALQDSQIVGTRALGGDAQVDETSNLGEASNTCGVGSGAGILPGASGWVTVSLAPGRYELVCNLPGHYAAGMYTQITIT
ncbi:sulfocyanin-like copper-binding protein [Cryobacterium sp. PH29-G1]|uniref:sulfocyanin-like copper-binding protein n=1 Tax=Cryobacterium sp. PH29-G1 TaxID=3046211 RepID=UPI0024BA1D86|nr:sulfocyanin-like copper-binding protein [Cryobacterium sp. PH29-G1]MDJ0348418.1 sulfocyanin-like copper-binding protein [Cryobacterium sp. PH29-G1]